MLAKSQCYIKYSIGFNSIKFAYEGNDVGADHPFTQSQKTFLVTSICIQYSSLIPFWKALDIHKYKNFWTFAILKFVSGQIIMPTLVVGIVVCVVAVVCIKNMSNLIMVLSVLKFSQNLFWMKLKRNVNRFTTAIQTFIGGPLLVNVPTVILLTLSLED